MQGAVRTAGCELVPTRYGYRVAFTAALLTIAAILLALLVWTVIEEWPEWRARSRTPAPRGLVLQLELREVESPFEQFEVIPIDRDGPALAIVDPDKRKERPSLIVVRFPGGEVLERVARLGEDRLKDLRAARWPASQLPAFDLDGDGVMDRLRQSSMSVGGVHVLSGVDSRELWSSYDPLEYETNSRLTPLGDLDGDGCSELAVLHPRMNRSRYDLCLLDAVFGVHSWLSVVSGARATR